MPVTSNRTSAQAGCVPFPDRLKCLRHIAAVTRLGLPAPAARFHANLQSLGFGPLVEFSDHVVGPAAVNLPGSVLSFPQHLVTPLIPRVGQLGPA